MSSLNDIMFKCFKSPENYYLYDRYSHTIIELKKSEYDELILVEDGKVLPEQSEILKNFQKNDILLPGRVDEIKHPETDYVDHISKNRIGDIILQVTQQCNLRCSYCVYGGKYKNRLHSTKRMNFDTAKKAMDFAFENSLESNTLMISFYGGEPLLEFELIKRCVEYSRKHVEGKKLLFNMTTNGTLLDDEIMRFLAENKFQVLISLDGSKEEHDASRVYESGKGTFDTIIDNIRCFKELHRNYVNQFVQFNAVITPKTNLSCIEEFFSVNDVLSDSHIMFNDVQPGKKDLFKDMYHDQFWIKREFEHLKLFMHLIGKLDEEYISKLVISQKNIYKELYKDLRKHKKISSVNHHSGPCVPGKNRLFVSADGKFYPCERVPELVFSCIGDLENGFNVEKAKEILNIGKITENECKNCWALRLCSSCLNNIGYTDELTECGSRENKLSQCEKNKKASMVDLLEICILNEFDFIIPYEEV